MPTIIETRAIHDLERDLGTARETLADCEAAEQAASDAVNRARESHSLGRILRSALLLTQKGLAQRQEETELAKARVRALDREADAERERLATLRARAAGAAIQGWRTELAALDGRVGDLIVATRDAFDDLDAAYRDLNQRSGGKLGSDAKGPANLLRIYGGLENALAELGRYYKPTTTNSTKGGGHAR